MRETMKRMKINDLFTIKRIPFNFVVVETILVNPDHHLTKNKKAVRTKENYFTKLSQAYEWILNESVDLESVDAVLDSIRKAKTEIVSAIENKDDRRRREPDHLNTIKNAMPEIKPGH